jgi:hypothetical protein
LLLLISYSIFSICGSFLFHAHKNIFLLCSSSERKGQGNMTMRIRVGRSVVKSILIVLIVNSYWKLSTIKSRQ